MILFKPRIPLAFFLLILWLCSLEYATAEISDKGKKLASVAEDDELSNLEDKEEEEEEDFFDFSFDNMDDFEEEGSLFDDDDSSFKETEDCAATESNSTGCGPVPTEPKFSDVLLQQLLRQAWGDFKNQIASNGSVGGLPIEPLDVDRQLSEPIKVSQTSASYKADVEMSGIKIFGLSTIELNQCSVLRNENLTALSSELEFHFSEILLNGTYSLKGSVGWWQLDSKGLQDFSISLINATIGVEVDLVQLEEAAVDSDDSLLEEGEDDKEHKCQGGDVIVTKLAFPLRYDDIDFRFTNLGAFANTMVNGVGIYFLQTQEVALIDGAKKMIQQSMSSLLCNN